LLLRPCAGNCIHALALGIALDSLGFIFGGLEPLDDGGLKIASRDAAPSAGFWRALFVLCDVVGYVFGGGKKWLAFLQQRSVMGTNGLSADSMQQLRAFKSTSTSCGLLNSFGLVLRSQSC
jgi:hypothetical protein